MALVRGIYLVLYGATTVGFAVCALVLIVLAGYQLWPAIDPTDSMAGRERFLGILETIGILTIAVAAIELSQTVLEEEIQRRAHLSSPTRVRRFLSRFMVVIVVSSAIEFLIATFELLHKSPANLWHAAAIGITSAVLLLAWSAFVRFNRGVERLEPEALAEVKREDVKVK